MDRSTLNARLNEAASHYANACYHEALDGYTAILAEHPAHPDALNDAGMTHYQLGNAEAAIEHFEKALEHDPSYEGAFFNLLDVTLEVDSPEQAATFFETFGAAIPESVDKTQVRARLVAFQQPLIGPEGTPNTALIETLQEQWGNDRWAASSEYVAYMAVLAAATDRPILECGSGLSTAVLALVSKQTGVEVWTFEHHPKWLKRVQTFLKRLGLSKHINLRLTPLRDYGSYEWYTPPADELPANFGLVVCDGPPGQTKGGRYGLLPVMRDALDSNCYILLDDVSRMGEQRVLQRWASETQISQESTEERTEFALFRMPAPQEPASDAGAPPSTASHPDRLRIGFVCGPDRKFIADIKREMSTRHDVRTAYFDESLDLRAVQRLMDWADVTWFEWCDQILVHASQKLKKTSAVVCRLHRYEAFTDWPNEINWTFVDTLIPTTNHIIKVLTQRVPDIRNRTKIEVIPSSVDLDHFPFKERKPGFDIAYVGYLHHRKNPSLLLQCLHELTQRDRRYHLHIAGSFQQPVWKYYFEHMLDALDLRQHVTMDGWIEDISTWLDDKQYLILPTIHEGNPYSVLEAAARGIKPLVHNFPGADELYPSSWTFNSAPEFAEMIQQQKYDSSFYHTFVAERYSLTTQIDKIDQLIRKLNTAKKPLGDVQSFYDDWDERLITDYRNGNPRVIEGIKYVLRNIPHSSSRILDIGCGIGWSSWEIKRHFPDAEIIGVDLSPELINVANRLFGEKDGLTFSKCDVTKEPLPGGSFDAIVMMDVYEHIPKESRDTFHRRLSELLSDNGQILLTCPTPSLQRYLAANAPQKLQPVDEVIQDADLQSFLEDINGKTYEKETVSIWLKEDYFHAALRRTDSHTVVIPDINLESEKTRLSRLKSGAT